MCVPPLVATRSRFGSCVINAIHYQNAASLPLGGRLFMPLRYQTRIAGHLIHRYRGPPSPTGKAFRAASLPLHKGGERSKSLICKRCKASKSAALHWPRGDIIKRSESASLLVSERAQIAPRLFCKSKTNATRDRRNRSARKEYINGKAVMIYRSSSGQNNKKPSNEGFLLFRKIYSS